MTGMHSSTIHSGLLSRVAERLDHLEPLGQVLDLLLADGLVSSWRSFLRQADQVEPAEELADGLGAHVGLEAVAVLLAGLAEVFLGQELAFS